MKPTTAQPAPTSAGWYGISRGTLTIALAALRELQRQPRHEYSAADPRVSAAESEIAAVLGR